MIANRSLTVLACLLGLWSAPSLAGGYFHLAQDGLCNKTTSEVTFGYTLDCEDGCGTCSTRDRVGFDSDGGGRLAPGKCATATIYLDPDVGDGCDATVTLNAIGTDCSFALYVDGISGGKSLDNDRCSAPMYAGHGDEHFQVDIK